MVSKTRMAAAMESFVRDRRIRRLLLTHHHEDHSGNAAMIAESCDAEIMGHPITVEKMRYIRPILPYQHIVWGQSREVDITPLPAEVGADGYRFIPIHTPGHSKDHTVYLESEHGWLFSGDLYLGERIKFFRSDEKIEEQIQSLRSVLQHDFESLFCAHNPRQAATQTGLSRRDCRYGSFVFGLGIAGKRNCTTHGPAPGPLGQVRYHG